MPEIPRPQRIVSLKPSVTVTLRDLGLLASPRACTNRCLEVCPELDGKGVQTVPYRLESMGEIIKSGIPCRCLASRTLGGIDRATLHTARLLGSDGGNREDGLLPIKRGGSGLSPAIRRSG